MRSHYPTWDISISLPNLFAQIAEGWHSRSGHK
jgi:hypothetical protein